jgi:hypothetical protein
MIKVFCRTSLDLHPCETWPEMMAAMPSVGDTIVSIKRHESNFQLQLQVVSITWKYLEGYTYGNAGYYPFIELHMTEHQKRLPSKSDATKGSITAFYEWYAPKVGRTVGSFI